MVRMRNALRLVSLRKDWLAIARSLGITQDDLPATVNRIKRCKDANLSDISHQRWVQCGWYIRERAVAAGFSAWSEDDTVCMLKAYARHVAGMGEWK